MDFLSLLSDGMPAWVDAVATVGVVINFLAAALLTAALLPPWLDTKKSRMTYGLGLGFFMNYIYGGGAMLMNSLINMFLMSNFCFPVLPCILFSVFISINLLSFYLNSYIVKVKRQNMREAAEKGLSEQAYWEQYLDPNRTSNLSK